ncbi:Protein N-acetyltransferase, RimJ/RimL family [Bosea sp. OK403]|uniref:GNAT family N-acetyltransferase n=1 Tax=Bosea sp. OK403 TaxID=1855286 RepID=UPI0008F4221B|nr:GNAT family N-acetyltransferase [Bosea sp. OK403]SFI35334.1 Protein N-acetyltransferase, RimJ/RimL family [Bosea sp. OK403]
MSEHSQQHEAVAFRRSSRLVLRIPRPDDLDFVVALFQRPELVAHRPHPVPDTPAASAERLARDIAHWRQHGFGRWAIEQSGALIGFGGLTVKPGVEGLNLSYHLDPASWGQGFASEFVAEAMAVAFGPLRAGRVIGLVRPANPASRRVLEKSGFVFEREIMLEGAPTQQLARYPQAD